MGKNNDSVNELNTHHMNKNYLKDAKLDETIQATTHLEEAIQHADVYLMALPTKAMREVATNIDKLLTSKKTFIHVAKGIENGTFKRVSEMIDDSISSEHNAYWCSFRSKSCRRSSY